MEANVTPALALKALRFDYPGSRAGLLHIDHLDVQPGEWVMLRGDSGSGKSTLLSLAAGVLLANSGSAELLGQDWRALPAGRRDAHRADHIGYLFQQFNLLPYLSVLDNVVLPCRFSKRRAERAAQGPVAAARHLLEALQLESSLWARPAGLLSVGQQQRVAAARALVGQPELVIADEPTSALDDQRRDAFMTLLRQACTQAGSALLFVSHDARLASHFERVIDLHTLNRAGLGSLPAAA
jgi:putative ABC transport system ATP-binding protein